MYIMGDSHSIGSFKEAVKKSQLDNVNLIHVGDFGLGFNALWYDLQQLDSLDEFLGNKGINLYVIRGNHDNPIFWNRRYGLNLPKYNNINLIDDYTIRKIEDRNILFMGGAISIDRLIRSAEHPPTWWVDEKFEYNILKLKEVLSKIDKLDIVVTHTAPGFALPYAKSGFPKLVQNWIDLEEQHLKVDLGRELMEERMQLHSIYKHIEVDSGKLPDYWFYGHFHRHSEEIHDKTKFVGLGINEIYGIK